VPPQSGGMGASVKNFVGRSIIMKVRALSLDLLTGFAKYMLILVVHFATTVAVPARITDYSQYDS